jgi:excisionase family DNA binding protein
VAAVIVDRAIYRDGRHVYRLTREGAIPAVKLGRYYRYRLDAIERFELGGVAEAGEAA